jgi:hypothetical protein
MSIEPLSILLKTIDNKPATLLRTRNGKTIARVHDDEYTPLFLSAQQFRDTLCAVLSAKHMLPASVWQLVEGSLARYEELRDIHFPDKGSVV